MSVEAGQNAGVADAGAARAATEARFGDVLEAGAGLFAALRRVATSLAALLVAEAQVLRASVALVFLASVALVALAVSLWACVVALIGWMLTLATHSVGVALAVLVALHLILVVAVWLMIKRALKQASFPATRHELRALRSELRGHVERFQHAAPPPEAEQAP